MNLPNKVTFSRIVLAIIFIPFFYYENIYSQIISLLIYIIAIFTDMYDGYIARKTNVVTGFGKFFDPLADKILLTIVFVALVDKQYVDSWVISLIIVREFVITGLRTLAAYRGISIAASKMGKLKTVFQMIFTSLGILYSLKETINYPLLDQIITINLVQIISYIALFFTYFSGYGYIVNAKTIIEGDL